MSKQPGLNHKYYSYSHTQQLIIPTWSLSCPCLPSLYIYVYSLLLACTIFLNTSKDKTHEDQSTAVMAKNGPYVYTKIEKEDPQELIHRRAQFLIHKVLERADNKTRQQHQRKRSSGPLIIIRVAGIRMRIGKKLRKLRKNNSCVCKNLVSRLIKSVKRFLSSSSSSRTISDLPPLFSLQV
ncbi:uncharacterized protein LOC108844865 [Raphanus sativus]|uniref:Uncharacterized protein LOC108844865 n=1 Tax=Raphanus sativus TaxID=3726 RepID=A0A9W3DE11_RAPSA|nr:uncharacterized protein LOC108844865 [Raphanus sativus]